MVNHKHPKWWDEECSLVIKNRNDACKNLIKNSSEQNYIIYKKISAKTKNTLIYKKKCTGKIFKLHLIQAQI